jgi:hypothetical protein
MDIADCAERSWAWTLDQVRWDDAGPWIPHASPSEIEPPPTNDRDCLYDGIGGLAVALAEIRLTRSWSDREESLADAIAERLSRNAGSREEPSLYVGLAGDAVALRLLDPPSVGVALDRLLATVTEQGWASTLWPDLGRPPVYDIVLGTAGVVLAALWSDDSRGAEIASIGCAALLAAAEPTERGWRWPMTPAKPEDDMPNFSHGTAGVATALAVSGRTMRRPDLVDAAVFGAQDVVGLADLSDGGLKAPHVIPHGDRDVEPYAMGWCHGPTGTQYLFGALSAAKVDDVGGHPPGELVMRCLTSVMTSGLPERIRPGFWDNDGRCCGTAGVADVFLTHYVNDTGGRGDEYLAFAETLTAALMQRAIENPDDPSQLYWRFTEHRRDPSLLDPGASWMQGAAGISAYLFRHARVLADGRSAPQLSLPDASVG